MDVFALNSATVNSSGSYASIVLLPTSTVTVELALYERISVSMEGTTGFSFDLVGNIARVANLGAADFTIGFAFNGQVATVILGPSGVSSSGWENTGSLLRIGALAGDMALTWAPTGSLLATKFFGNQSFEQSFEVSGALQRTQRLSGQMLSSFTDAASLSIGYRNYLPYSEISIDVASSGTLKMLGRLQGTSSSTWLNEVSLSQGYRQAIPAAVTTFSFTLEGALRNTQALSGQTVQAFSGLSSLSSIVSLQGTVVDTFITQGTLANNAAGYDLKTVLMIRPESQREMIR